MINKYVTYCSKPPGHASVTSFTPVDFSPLPPHFSPSFLPSFPPFCFLHPCPVTEPGVWTDCDIGCVGDRLAGVISEGEENSSASLYLTPSLLHQPLMRDADERYRRRKCYSFIF